MVEASSLPSCNLGFQDEATPVEGAVEAEPCSAARSALAVKPPQKLLEKLQRACYRRLHQVSWHQRLQNHQAHQSCSC